MNIPEQIKVRVVCEGEPDMSGFIVELVVSTGQKSAYRIYFPKTGSSGISILTRGDFVGQFTDQWESGLMDHGGTPEEAQPVVSVRLYDPTWSLENRDAAMAWPLLTHERTKWSTRDEQYRYRTSSRNLEFSASPIMFDLENTSEIILPVERKVGGTMAL